VTESTGNDGYRIIASLDQNTEINSDIFNSKGADWSEVYYRLQQVQVKFINFILQII